MASAVECAAHCFVSVTRLRDLIGGGQTTHMPNGQYDLATVRREYIAYLQKAATGRGSDYGALSKMRTRLEAGRADAIEFKNALARGEFVELSLFKSRFEAMFVGFREIALATGGAISDSLTAHCEQLDIIIDTAISNMLDQLSSAEIVAPTRNEARRQDGEAAA